MILARTKPSVFLPAIMFLWVSHFHDFNNSQ